MFEQVRNPVASTSNSTQNLPERANPSTTQAGHANQSGTGLLQERVASGSSVTGLVAGRAAGANLSQIPSPSVSFLLLQALLLTDVFYSLI